MTSRSALSGLVGVSAQLEIHRPPCEAYAAALACIEASRTAARLIARLPRSEWPGEVSDDCARLWNLLASRGLPAASTGDLRTLRAYARWLRGGASGSPGPAEEEDGMVIDEADDDPLAPDRTTAAAAATGSGPGSPPDGKVVPLRRGPSGPPPDGLVQALETALDQARAFRDIHAAMRLAGIGGAPPGPIEN